MGHRTVIIILLPIIAINSVVTDDDGSIPAPECADKDTNEFGACAGCAGQVFLSSDGAGAFVCSGNENNGCQTTCPSGYTIVPDFKYGAKTPTFLCYPAQDMIPTGGVEFYCRGAKNAIIGANLGAERCQCDGQMFVSDDCRFGYTCGVDKQGEFEFIHASSCDENEQVGIDYLTRRTRCNKASYLCPKSGGMSSGCGAGAPKAPYTPKCHFMDKIFSNETPCECDGQTFVDEDCQRGFVCLEEIPGNLDVQGCLMRCRDGYNILPSHLSDGEYDEIGWLCVDQEVIPGCPGPYRSRCFGYYDDYEDEDEDEEEDDEEEDESDDDYDNDYCLTSDCGDF